MLLSRAVLLVRENPDMSGNQKRPCISLSSVNQSSSPAQPATSKLFSYRNFYPLRPPPLENKHVLTYSCVLTKVVELHVLVPFN